MATHQVKARNSKKLKAFGKRLKALRTEKGWSQEKLAARAGVSENTIVTLEAGKLNTTIATCFEVARALGVDASRLFEF
ncbi:MAG TPA: helix-turn-helix transcriptional regulator [Chryseosolibacter sp.]